MPVELSACLQITKHGQGGVLGLVTKKRISTASICNQNTRLEQITSGFFNVFRSMDGEVKVF